MDKVNLKKRPEKFQIKQILRFGEKGLMFERTISN